MSEITTDNPFLEELVVGLHTIAGIPTEDRIDPRNKETGHNAERNAYALEAIAHGLAAVSFEIGQLREEQRTANLIERERLLEEFHGYNPDRSRQNEILERLGEHPNG